MIAELYQPTTDCFWDIKKKIWKKECNKEYSKKRLKRIDENSEKQQCKKFLEEIAV